MVLSQEAPAGTCPSSKGSVETRRMEKRSVVKQFINECHYRHDEGCVLTGEHAQRVAVLAREPDRAGLLGKLPAHLRACSPSE